MRCPAVSGDVLINRLSNTIDSPPSEMNNLYGKKGYERITANLKGRLKDLVKKFEDEDAAKMIDQPITVR